MGWANGSTACGFVNGQGPHHTARCCIPWCTPELCTVRGDQVRVNSKAADTCHVHPACVQQHRSRCTSKAACHSKHAAIQYTAHVHTCCCVMAARSWRSAVVLAVSSAKRAVKRSTAAVACAASCPQVSAWRAAAACADRHSCTSGNKQEATWERVCQTSHGRGAMQSNVAQPSDTMHHDDTADLILISKRMQLGFCKQHIPDS